MYYSLLRLEMISFVLFPKPRNQVRILIRHFHISHNVPYLPPKILHKHCFQFLFEVIQNLGGGGGGGRQIRCIMENVEVAYTVKSGYRYKIPCFYDELFSGQSEMKTKALETTNGKYN